MTQVHRYRPVSTTDKGSSHILLKNMHTKIIVKVLVHGEDDGSQATQLFLRNKRRAVTFTFTDRGYHYVASEEL